MAEAEIKQDTLDIETEAKNDSVKMEKCNPFDKLDEYILESIFIFSKNPELSKISMGLFRISHYTPTQVKYLIKNVYSKKQFSQSIFCSKYPKLAKKEELVIELVRNGIDIHEGRKSSIYNRIFMYKMNKALNVMLQLFKKVKIAYIPDILKRMNTT
ncbi:hypothetical protein BB559_002852 [Furculomyces boomerangus]|uniref:Uncharacterized protein n=1 Tax=Furculomyces boomerangus TaxID=61424 RepID=A0A2T9YRU2_9FUNG|nr:hypothetical protein BB559_002852 [Furculomyces boomerangus]